MKLEIINTIVNTFTAFGTVSAVIVALYLARKDSIPKLRVHGTIAVLTPDMTEHLWLSCTNIGKQQITCLSFAFNPNKYLAAIRIMPHPGKLIHALSIPILPSSISYSERIDQHYAISVLHDKIFGEKLSNRTWLARIQLMFLWRVVATTNVKEFEGSLSKTLIQRILKIKSEHVRTDLGLEVQD